MSTPGRRTAGIALAALCLWAGAGCGRPAAEHPAPATAPSLASRVERARDAAARYLVGRQDPDGAWRSDTYGSFKDGPSLTPLVLYALRESAPSASTKESCRRGLEYLAATVSADEQEAGPDGLQYPVYSAAAAVIVLGSSDRPEHQRARDAWLRLLRARQLTEDLGWRREDKQYGGWGFSAALPRKPKPGTPAPPLTESNLSATLWALEGLRSAGCPAHDPAFARALVFVERCQNYGLDSAEDEPRGDDGGFFFIYDDPIRNKAGVQGKNRPGQTRFVSYGSTTADGLRALLACGLPANHPRVLAGRSWLRNNFSATEHPGNFTPERAAGRPALYYYYCWSVAQALRAIEGPDLPTPTGDVRWGQALGEELLKRQQPDGSWVNPASLYREDDPILATSLALSALSATRGHQLPRD